MKGVRKMDNANGNDILIQTAEITTLDDDTLDEVEGGVSFFCSDQKVSEMLFQI
jgi:hypothetical protein